MRRFPLETSIQGVAPFWRYHQIVTSIQIKNVPQEVHESLQRRARLAGQSLQEFLLEELRMISRQEVLDEIFERARNGRFELQPGQAAGWIREDRESRDRR